VIYHILDWMGLQ